MLKAQEKNRFKLKCESKKGVLKKATSSSDPNEKPAVIHNSIAVRDKRERKRKKRQEKGDRVVKKRNEELKILAEQKQ